ncbi:MAG: hypothetical protein ACTSYR_05310 [Candidatus Odinarchaeia archaeon]
MLSWVIESRRYFMLSVILAVIFLVVYSLVGSNLIVELAFLGVFLIYLLVSAYFKLDFRIPVLIAILLLLFSAVILTVNLETLANQGAIVAYYYLVVGVLGLFVDYLRENRSKKQNIC